jgi:hypothetical protein
MALNCWFRSALGTISAIVLWRFGGKQLLPLCLRRGQFGYPFFANSPLGYPPPTRYAANRAHQ